MKKAELLAMKKLLATPKMMKLVQQDPVERKIIYYTYGASRQYDVYQRYQYFRAVTSNGILKVAAFSRRHLAAGMKEPEYEIFLSKEENTHLTYEVSSGKWKTGKIDSLDFDLDYGHVYGNKPWSSEETTKLVNAYLGTGTLETKEAVLRFQNEVGAERLKKRHKSEIEQIDAVMNTVPELPKDFDDWILNSAFIRETYLIYHYGDKENKAYCTHCKKDVRLRIIPKHNTNGICPSCRRNALQKSWKKQKYLFDNKNVGIIQPLTDGSGYMLRKFKCKIERVLENDWKVDFAGCWETERFRLDHNFRKVEYFEFGEYKNTGVNRWCHELNHGFNSYYGYGQSDDCVLYYRNLKRMRKDTELKYMPIEELWRHNQGYYGEVISMFWNIRHRPRIEYFLKAHLYNLAWDLAKGYCREGLIDWEAKKPWQALNITKDQLAMCAKMNINARQLSVLQTGNHMGIKLNPKQITFFTKEIGPDLAADIFCYGHVEKMMRYMKQLKTEITKLGDYVDYLEDVRRLQIPPSADVLFPKKFTETHQRLALQRQEKEDALKKMEICEKDKVLKQMLPELREIYEIEDDNFVMILPTCKEDFNREGRENHNCVGGSYYDKMLKGNCVIMFLRRKTEPEKAFCTVEMNGSRVVQCRSIRNGTAPEDAEKFMSKFSTEVAKRIEKRRKEIMLTVTV